MMVNASLRNKIVATLFFSIFVITFLFPVLLHATQTNLHIRAQSVILMDAFSGQILYERNPRVKIPPASLTKILTLFLAFDAISAGHLKMDDVVTVSTKAWRTGGSRMFLKAGEREKVENLIKGITVVSGNDACVALAETLSGSEEAFVLKMNENARIFGLEDTQFKNSHGMPAKGQYTTALDIANLARRYIEAHPEAINFHSILAFEHNGIWQRNRNILLQREIGVDGLITGQVEESGYHLVATARRDSWRLIAVIMGSKTLFHRAQEAQDLLEYGFKNFSVVETFKKRTSFGSIKVKRGKMSTVKLIPAEDGRVVVAKGEEKLVSVNTEAPDFIAAPVLMGQRVGKVMIRNGEKMLREINLLSSSDVPKGFSFFWLFLRGGMAGLFVVLLILIQRIRRSHRKRFH
jgi:D-alanyl-D-alanine carboxypeptidase (penicillin-binding protein 5/6)